MGLEFKIDISSSLGDSFKTIAKRYPEEMHETIRIGIKRGVTQILESARNNHRFKNDTHTLQDRALVEDFDKIDQLIGVAQIDNVIASYGPRIHEGFGAWDPDPFLHNAGKREEKRVINSIFKDIKKIGK